MENVQAKIEIIKKERKKVLIKLQIYNISVIVALIVTTLISLASIFSEQIYINIIPFAGYSSLEELSLLSIFLTICMMVKTVDKSGELKKIERFNNIIRFDQGIPEEQEELVRLHTEIERVYYDIQPAISGNEPEKDAILHKKRMLARKYLISTMFVASALIFTIGLRKQYTFPFIGFLIGICIYPAVLLEFYMSVFFRKKSKPDWEDIMLRGVGIDGYEELSRGKMNIECKQSILRRALERLHWRQLIWNQSALSVAVIALFFSILEFWGNLTWIIAFLDFPFKKFQMISTFLLFVSTIISIMQLIMEKEQVGQISKVVYLCNNEVDENFFENTYSDLLCDGTITDLDIARGKFEYSMKCIEKGDIPDLAHCQTKENEFRTALSRINGFGIYGIGESIVYFLWYREWDIQGFLAGCCATSIVYMLLIVITRWYKDKKYNKIATKNKISQEKENS